MRRRVVEVVVDEPEAARRDPRADPRAGDVLERVMRPLRNPVRREVISIRRDDADRVFVRFRTRFGRPREQRLDAWRRWSGLACVVPSDRRA